MAVKKVFILKAVVGNWPETKGGKKSNKDSLGNGIAIQGAQKRRKKKKIISVD